MGNDNMDHKLIAIGAAAALIPLGAFVSSVRGRGTDPLTFCCLLYLGFIAFVLIVYPD